MIAAKSPIASTAPCWKSAHMSCGLRTNYRTRCRTTFDSPLNEIRSGMTRRFIAVEIGTMLFLLLLLNSTHAVTRLTSADAEFWDIQDTTPWAQDSGGIATGGRANPFDGFGYLKLRVRSGAGVTLVPNQHVTGFGLAYDDGERFDTITPVMHGGVVVARAIYAPRESSYLRSFDSFTNTTADDRLVDVAWGGAAGAYQDGGFMTVATTSNGDREIDLTDTFVTVMQNAKNVSDPLRGPSGHGPS